MILIAIILGAAILVKNNDNKYVAKRIASLDEKSTKEKLSDDGILKDATKNEVANEYVVENYDYSYISSVVRDSVYDYIMNNIPDSYIIGAPIGDKRLSHNLYMCFKGVEGESLMMLLDMNGIEVSTGSACSSGSLQPSSTLVAIGMDKEDIHSCIRMSFSGSKTEFDIDYACRKLKECVEKLRSFR